MTSDAWTDVLGYLGRLGAHDVILATELLDRAIDRDGIDAINDALGDACRSSMDRVVFPAGTVDIHAVVDTIALRIVETSGDARPVALDRQRSLLVFLGSVGLPCAARNEVATWSAEDRLHDSIVCLIGLVGIVASDAHISVADAVARIAPPGPVETPEGTFGLAWRGPSDAEPFAGVVPHGYTAHITFLGAEQCSLRSIFAGVAMLRDVKVPIDLPVDLPIEEHVDVDR